MYCRRGVAEFHSPEARRGREKFDAHALPFVTRITQINDAAFLLFLRLRVGNHQHLSVVHLMLQRQEAALAVDDHGFARLAELLSVVPAALRLHAHLTKDARTPPGRGCSHFAHASCWNAPAAASIAPTARCSRYATLRRSALPQFQPHRTASARQAVRPAAPDDKPVLRNQNSTRKAPWITRGPPPTAPAVVPTAVAVALPTVAVILPKFPLLSFPTGLAKFVWLKRLKKSARNRRWTLSVRNGKLLVTAKL